MELAKIDVGGIRVGPFNNRSAHGFKGSELKSGICKYYRRGEDEKFVFCVAEMAYFGLVENGKPLVSNLVNRCKILIMEDMSCAEMGLVVQGIEKIEKFEKSGEMQDLLDFCGVVVKARRSRLVSYLNAEARGKEVIGEEGKSLLGGCAKVGDSAHVAWLGRVMLKALVEKSEELLVVYCKLCESKEKAAVRYRRKDPVYLFWEVMEGACKKIGVLAVKCWRFAFDQFNKRGMKERYAYGVWLGLIVLKSEIIDWRVVGVESLNRISQVPVLERLDPYVLEDFHVNSAKYSLGKFALEGALVVDEDERLVGEERLRGLRENYVRGKMRL